MDLREGIAFVLIISAVHPLFLIPFDPNYSIRRRRQLADDTIARMFALFIYVVHFNFTAWHGNDHIVHVASSWTGTLTVGVLVFFLYYISHTIFMNRKAFTA